MKYIRTKDTLASVERKEDIELFKRAGQRVVGNIEELCDEFVVYGEHIIPSHTHFLSLTDIGIKSCLEAKAIIYGAIWTNKGLIYVAKMNEKGELELL